MVEERITDGRRIAQLLASEIEGREDGGLGALSVGDADPDAAEGARAYDVTDGQLLARVFVGEERARIEFVRGGKEVRSAIGDGRGDLAVREEDGRTVLEVESGAAVKPAARALAAAAA